MCAEYVSVIIRVQSICICSIIVRISSACVYIAHPSISSCSTSLHY